MTPPRSVDYPRVTPDEIAKRFDDAGPTARYCLEFSVMEIDAFYTNRDSAINMDTAKGMVDALLDHRSHKLRIGDVSHRLCVVRRSNSDVIQFTVEPIADTDSSLSSGTGRSRTALT